MPYFNGYSTIAQKLAQGLHFGFSVSASLFDGMAGIGNTLIDCFHSFGKQQYFDWALEAAHFAGHTEYHTTMKPSFFLIHIVKG